jgi:hypothetical protein
LISDLAPLRRGGFGIVLGKGRGDEGGDDGARSRWHASMLSVARRLLEIEVGRLTCAA